ncbi:MAG: ABC transporter ATP-binding protein [Acidimicrobiales bacterium]
MARVQIVGARKSYGKTEVIHGVDVDIEDEEFVVLVGPSGCGKSTLLRMVAGLERITGGDILIDGTRVNDLPPKERGCAMVFQNYALYPHMKVYENMAFSLMLHKAPKALIDERVRQAASALEIEPYLDRYPKALSGGQRQRVAIGRALVRDPSVFLFDEPLSNLDAKLRVAMRVELKELQRRLRRTVVYVTHDQVEAMTMGDRVVIMRDGVVEQSGSALEVYDRPRNTFVAGFIGSPAMNMVEATLHRADGSVFAQSDTGQRWPVGVAAPAGEGQKVIYGIRPEHLRLTGPGDGVRAVVTVIEHMGAQTAVALRSGGERGQALELLSPERLDVKPDQEVWLAPTPDAVHLFDATSAERLGVGAVA